MHLDILGPVKQYEDLNNTSVVARLVSGQISFLLAGDMEQEAEADLAAANDLKSTILKVGHHHGSSTSSGAAFLAEVKPSTAVISVGEGNSYGHPAADTLGRLVGVDAYRTDLCGTVVVVTDGKGYTVSTAKDTKLPAPVPQGELLVTASISDPTPAQNGTITAYVTAGFGGIPVPGAEVTVTCHYKSTTSTYNGRTDLNGVAQIPFSIGTASVGYTVVTDIIVSSQGKVATAVVSFTPDGQQTVQEPKDPDQADSDKTVTVYVTKTGSKYHRAGCRYLSASMIPISLQDAVKSYSPCSVCNPPR